MSAVVGVMGWASAGCDRSAPPPAKLIAPAPAKASAPAGAAPTARPSGDARPAATPASTPPASTPATGEALTVAGVKFVVPAGWKQAPPANQMRLAELQVADPSNDAGKACVVAFTSAGGDVQSNIARWAGQMRDAAGQPAKADVTQREIGGFHVSVVELAGAYQGMGEAAKPEWMLRGAIVETPGGLLFVKMTGPASGMGPAAAGWRALVDSIAKP